MKKCLHCHSAYDSGLDVCSTCHHTPERVEGFPVYAPAFIHQGGGFKEEYFSMLAHNEELSFWFNGRNRLILSMLGKYAEGFNNLLEIGCGTGFVLSGIARAFPKARMHGSEIFLAGLSFAARRVPRGIFMQMDARHIPYTDEFDTVCAFDVLEHIEEDEQVLTQIHQSMHSSGILAITVPQHDWLWSASDDYACHVRRYSALDIENKIKAAGFDILRSTSFVSALLPAMLVSRFLNKKTAIDNYDPNAEFTLPRWLNGFFEFILNLEVLLIGLGFNFPAGGSRLVIAQKR